MSSLITAITENNLNCLVLGDVGVGKSQLINQHLSNLDGNRFISTKVSFSPQTITQNILDPLFDKEKFTKKSAFLMR